MSNLVTYLDNSNAKQYHILFDKATALLKAKKPDNLTTALRQYSNDQNATADELWSEFTISSLNEYFAYLEDILKAAHQDSNEDAERFYVRLPLDEDVFEINANTREVNIPNSFNNNGIGVQGDELAEVLYFTIDRFFDMQDLASDDIHIAIQWELTRNGESVKGFSRNFGKDIESVPGKIIFGWPISHELTETSGSIRFAVRFYEVDANNQSFKYSLSTLPANVKINSSLDHEVIARSQEEINHGSIITQRIKNAGIYNPSMPIPSAPVITTALHVITPETDARIVDLPADNSKVELGVGASPADVGVIGYIWKKFPYIEETGLYDSSSVELYDDVEIKYVLTTEDLNKDFEYYTKTGEGNEAIYSLLDVENQLKVYNSTTPYPYLYAHTIGEPGEEEVVNTPEVSNSPVGYEKVDAVAGGFITEVYKKISTVKVNTTGIYTVDISAKALVNTTTSSMRQDQGIKIPGPLAPVITMPAAITTGEGTEQVAHVIIDTTAQTLTPSVVRGEDQAPTAEVGESYNVDMEGKWQVYRNGDWVDVETTENVVIVNEIEDSLPTLTIEDIVNAETIGDLYRLVVTSTRNKVSTSVASPNYRVTHAPGVPEVNVRDWNPGSNRFEWTARNYQTSSNNIKIANVNSNLDVAVTAQGLLTDEISYIWVKANRTDEENARMQYKVDLPDDVRFADLINKVNAAIGDTGERDRDDIIESLNRIATVTVDDVDAQSRYTTSYTPTESGVYYCVAINELNNNIAVNVSPFFIVS